MVIIHSFHFPAHLKQIFCASAKAITPKPDPSQTPALNMQTL